MRKTVGALMLVVVLLAGGLALADGAMYDGDIQFGNYTFGLTFAELKAQEFINSVEYRHYIVPSRTIADARQDLFNNLYWEDSETGLLSMKVYVESRTVAQHEYVQTELYFNVPVVDGVAQKEEAAAVLTGGKYIFNDDPKTTFKDLTEKLTGVYGEPWLKTSKSDEIWGEVIIPDAKSWLNDNQFVKEQGFNPSYVVWKSSTNNVMVVLTTAKIWGTQWTYLSYVDMNADATLLSLLEGTSGMSPTQDTSSSGL